jgi:hypothetical protein
MKTIKINYKDTNKREYYLLKFLEWVTPLNTNWLKRGKESWGLSTSNLLQYPYGTLGHSLGAFLQAQQLEPVPRAERHDCYHVLLQYGTSLLQESQMQWCLIGAGKRSIFTIGAALLSVIVLPERCYQYWQAYQRGKGLLNISKWQFNHLLHVPTHQLMQLINHKQ